MARLSLLRIVSIVTLIVGTTSNVQASIFVPDGLSPGDKYHLAFVTSGTTTALSYDIADYNNFVNEQAEQSGAITKGWGIEWYAIASAGDGDARDNAVVSAPVYLLDSKMIATDFDDMWDGELLNPLHVDQFGTVPHSDLVWTGSLPSGQADTSSGPRSFFLGDTIEAAVHGYHTSTNNWMAYDIVSLDSNLHLYSLSAELEVPSTDVIPEPSSLLAWAGLATAGVWVSRRRKAG